MSAITPCAYGCTSRGLHLADGQPHDGCRGCAPRLAEYGTLCAWCWARLNGDLVDVPTLIAHLTHLGQPNAGHQRNDGPTPHGDPAERTILPAQWLEADELASAVTGWVQVILEEHPTVTNPPRGMRWATGGKARHRATRDEWDVEPRPVGLLDDGDDLIRWLLPHLPWVSAQEWAHEMRRDIGTQVATLKARWPMEERGHAVQHIPCPRCDAVTLWYTPPTPERPTMQVSCVSEQCGRIFTEDEWERMKALIAHATTEGLIA